MRPSAETINGGSSAGPYRSCAGDRCSDAYTAYDRSNASGRRDYGTHDYSRLCDSPPVISNLTGEVIPMAAEAGRITEVERVPSDVPIRAKGLCFEGVSCEELRGGWVVVAGAEVVEAGVGVLVLAVPA